MENMPALKYFNSFFKFCSFFNRPFAFVENIFNVLFIFFPPLLVFLYLFLFRILRPFFDLLEIFAFFDVDLGLVDCMIGDEFGLDDCMIDDGFGLVDCMNDVSLLKNEPVGGNIDTFYLTVFFDNHFHVYNKGLLHVYSGIHLIYFCIIMGCY